MRHLRNPHLRDARVRRTRRVLSGAMAVALVAAAATFVPGGHVEAATQSTSSTYTVLNTNGAVTASLSYSAVSTYNYTKTSANATNSNGDSTLSSKGNQTGDYVQPYDTNNTTTPSLLLSSSYTCAAVTTPVTANTEKDCSSAGTITINFSQPLNNPLLLIGGIGGSSNTTPDNAKFILTSATATGGTPTLSMVGGGGTNQSMQVVGGNTIDNKGFPSTSCVNASSYASGATARAGCGTIQITGTGITSLTFNIVGQMWLAKGTTYGGQVIQNGTSDTLDEYTLAIANSSPTPKPFTCTTSTVYNANGSPTQMNVQYAGSTTFTKLGAASGWLYNAIGYDAYNGINLIYAVSQTSPTNTTAYPANHLLAIDATGAVNDLGAITGISTTGASAATTDSGNINSGFIDDSGNFWFLDSNGTAILYEITAANLAKATSQNNSLSSTPATTFTAQGTTKIVAPDLTYANGYAWGIQNATNTIYRVNLSTGAVSTYTVSGLPAGSWGAAWTYANGNLGFDNNSATSTTGLAQISVANPSGTPTFTVVSNTGGPASSSNDGTACKSTANVAITKAASTSQDPAAGATVATGATVTWTLTITGQGPGNASGALVTDTLPSGYTNIAVVGSTAATNACTISGQTVTCNDGFGAAGLAPGATATVTITATAPTTIGTCLSNTASILGNDATNGTQNSNSVPTCTVAVPVSLSIVKSATTNPSPLTGAGQTITYSFLVTNTSAAAPVTGIKVTDAMTGLSAVSCPQTTLAAGSSETCTATYTTTGADVSAGSVTNPSATVTGTGPSGNTVTGTSNTVTVKIVWSPICGADGTAVLYSSQANGNVKQVSITGGAATTTTLTGWAGLSGVQNSGDSQVNGIGITPDGSALYALQRNDPGNNVVEMLKWTASTGWTAVANSAFTTALTGNGAIVAGAVDPVNGVYYFGGTNYVSGTGSVFLLYSWNPATNTFASVGQVPLQDSATASQGHSGDLVFDQSGNLFLESAIVGGNSTPPAQITAVPAAQLATATGGTISANTSRVAVTTAIRDFNGIAMDLSGNVWMGDEPDLVEANPSTGAQVGTTLASAVAPHSTDLASCNPATSLIVQKSIASRVAAADQFNLNITASPSTSSTLLDTDTTTGNTTGLQKAEAIQLVTPNTTYGFNETMATGSVGALAGYTTTWSCTNTTTGTAVASGTGTSGSASVPAGQTVTCVFTNTAKTASLSLAKSVSRGYATEAGQILTYSFLVTNTGGQPLTAITILDPSPASAGSDSYGDNFSGTGPLTNLSCPQATLAAGASETCTAGYTVTQADLKAGKITNTATATGISPSGATVPSNPSSAQVLTIPLMLPLTGGHGPWTAAVAAGVLLTLAGMAYVVAAVARRTPTMRHRRARRSA